MNAHFFFEANASHRVAFTKAAIGVNDELRHDEERDAFDASWCAFKAGEDQVNVVGGHRVLTTRDPDFLARNLISTVGLRDGFGAQEA